MHLSRFVFYQLTSSLSQYHFQKCVDQYHGDHYVKSLTCWHQFLCLCFGQLTHRESLRSIVLCLNTFQNKLYHLGLHAPISRSTLADANELRDWRIYETFGAYLIGKARRLYQHDTTFLGELDGTFYALDATTIADLYKRRRDIEQFFRWIKGHLKIKTFWGTSPNAVKTQIWIAICTYLMVAIIRKQLKIERNMYQILQILSVTPFEKTPLTTLFSEKSMRRFLPTSEFQPKLQGF